MARPEQRLSALGQQVDQAIRRGVAFLKSQQRPGGSWTDVEKDARTGMTSLVVLWRCSPPARNPIHRRSKGARIPAGLWPEGFDSTYAISLQTMVYAAAEPAKRHTPNCRQRRVARECPDQARRPADWAGSWSYSESKRGRPGDNSNSQYALLGLHAASEVGVPVKQTVWELSLPIGSAARNATEAGLTLPIRTYRRQACPALEYRA